MARLMVELGREAGAFSAVDFDLLLCYTQGIVKIRKVRHIDMGKISEYIGSQCGNPRGFVGKVCCLIMNIINNSMYRMVISAMHRK